MKRSLSDLVVAGAVAAAVVLGGALVACLTSRTLNRVTEVVTAAMSLASGDRVDG